MRSHTQNLYQSVLPKGQLELYNYQCKLNSGDNAKAHKKTTMNLQYCEISSYH